jgi:hypothetical protein
METRLAFREPNFDTAAVTRGAATIDARRGRL